MHHFFGPGPRIGGWTVSSSRAIAGPCGVRVSSFRGLLLNFLAIETLVGNDVRFSTSPGNDDVFASAFWAGIVFDPDPYMIENDHGSVLFAARSMISASVSRPGRFLKETVTVKLWQMQR